MRKSHKPDPTAEKTPPPTNKNTFWKEVRKDWDRLKKREQKYGTTSHFKAWKEAKKDDEKKATLRLAAVKDEEEPRKIPWHIIGPDGLLLSALILLLIGGEEPQTSGVAASTAPRTKLKKKQTEELEEIVESIGGGGGGRVRRQKAAERAIEFASIFGRSHLLPRMLKALEEADEKLWPAIALGGIGGDESLAALMNLLESPLIEDRVAGLQGLNRMRDPRCLKKVRPLALNEEREVRKAAIVVIGNLRDKESLEDLVHSLYAEDEGIAKNAHWALKKISGQTFPLEPETWEQWLADPE